LLVAPLVGLLIYLITNSESMAKRNIQQAQRQQEQFDSYVRDTASSGGSAAEIEKAKGLLDSGAITQDEYNALKNKALAT
jgi:hypothetical protein